jgi:hypothetical protein
MLFAVVYEWIELCDEDCGDGWARVIYQSFQEGMFRRKGREDDV